MENSNKEVKSLPLWSWHTPDFSLTEGTVEHQRSRYYKTPGVSKSYKELSKQLIKRFKLEPEQADQFVWCYTEPNAESPAPDTIKVEWQLEVPEDRVLAKVCSAVWHCIVWCNGGERGLVGTPPKKYQPLWAGIAQRSGCGLKWDDFNKGFYDFWYNKTDEELWDALFLDRIHGECTHILLQHPLEGKWVKPTDPKDDQKQ